MSTTTLPSTAAPYGATLVIAIAAVGVHLAFIDLIQGYPFVTIFLPSH